MKRIINGVVACSIALAMVTTVAAQSAQQGMAKVVRIKGSARYMTSGSSMWEPLKVGEVLRPGAIIQTASDSYVDLVLNSQRATSPIPTSLAAGPTGMSGVAYQPAAKQNAVRIFENSVLSLDKLSVDHTGVGTVTDTSLNLKAGSIFGTVKKLSAASKYEVKVPNGVAGIRGTIYFITAQGVLRVVSGSVVLAYVGSSGSVVTQVVAAGQQFDIRTGELTTIASNELRILHSYIVPLSGVSPAIYVPIDQTVYPVSQFRPTTTPPSFSSGNQGGPR